MKLYLKKKINKILSNFGYKVIRFPGIKEMAKEIYQEKATSSVEKPQGVALGRKIGLFIDEEYSHLQFSGYGLQKLIREYEFDSVLDIGCGAGHHSEIFLKHGKHVTGLDYGDSIYFEKNKNKMEVIIGDFNKLNIETKYDCVWASHILEHQLNVNKFLIKIHSLLKEGGVLAITVPPLKHQIVGGHVSLWNGGLLLYNLVLAGFDCKDAKVYKYGYNISVLLTKTSIKLPHLVFDYGDIDRLSNYLPAGCGEAFNGDITILM